MEFDPHYADAIIKRYEDYTSNKIINMTAGRPTVMTPEVLNKLEEIFAIGGTDQEACFFANISHQTLYDYQKKYPEFVERKEALKEKPILKARRTVVKALDNPEDAKWYLERKKKKEFAQRTEFTGKEGEAIKTEFKINNEEFKTVVQNYVGDKPAEKDTSGEANL